MYTIPFGQFTTWLPGKRWTRQPTLRLAKGAAGLLQLNTSCLWEGQVWAEKWVYRGKDGFEWGECMLLITAQVVACQLKAMVLISTITWQSCRQIHILCSRKYSHLGQMPGRQVWLPPCAISKQLSQQRGSRTEQSKGHQLYCESSRPEGKQTLGTALDMHDGPFCAPSTKNFFLQGKSTTIPHMAEQTNPQHRKQMKQINLTFKISCSCFKTAWTSSCKSHLNSSSYIVER